MQIRNIGQLAKVKFNIDKLLSIEKQLSVKYAARVGILGDKNARTTDKSYKKVVSPIFSEHYNPNITNAEIGIIHEFGVVSSNIPERSFLRKPLRFKSAELAKTCLAILDDLNKENIIACYKRLAVKGEQIVQRAFATAGFGSWAPLKYREGSPLIDTGQLRKSISSRVVSR